MLTDLKRLGKETVIYGFSTVFSRLLNFVLLPFYTHLLATEEYGVIAVVYTYIAFLNSIFQYGMDQAYLRFATDPEGRDRETVFSTAFWCVGATSVAFAVFIVKSGAFGSLSGYCAAILALDAISIVPFAELRRAHKAWQFVSIKSANIVVNVAFNVLMLWKLRTGIEGVFFASLAASAVSLALLAPAIASRLKPRLDVSLLKELLGFALPYVPSGLASTAVQVIDRPILQRLTDNSTVGIYQANYRLGILMMLLVNMFDAAWRPFFLEKAKSPDAGPLFARVLTYFVLASTLIALALSMFLTELVALPVLGKPLIHPAYWSGLPIVPVVLVGYIFNGIYINFMAQVSISKRTDLLIGATLLGAVVNVGVNLALIPAWKMMGAAVATLAAYAAMSGWLFFFAQRQFHVPYEYRRLAHLGAALAAAGAIWWMGGRIFAFTGSYSNWVVLRLLALAAYPAILWWSGFFNAEEKRALRFAR